MTDTDHHDIKIPTGVLIGFGLVLAGIVIAVAFFRFSGQEPLAQVPEPDNIVEQRQLRFLDGGNGTVEVLEVRPGTDDTLIYVIQPGDGGFVRGVLRSMARARRSSDISEDAPFIVIQLANGTVLLEDPVTGQRIDLQAFGPASIEAFQALLRSADS
ncbi:MAG: photosynthetic complex assembly protein PuhC [Wenzhouxiangella sp.]